MTLRRRLALAEPVARAARQLKQCETATRLLDRVRPVNLSAERARLAAAIQMGRRAPPEPEYGSRPELGEVRRALHETGRALDSSDVEQALLLERCEELQLEAELAECVGQAAFSALAARRFPLPPDDAELRGAARELLAAAVALQETSTHRSDDERDPDSLLSQLSRRVFAERLSTRVEVDSGLVALAAVADGVVRVRGGTWLSASVGRRIALHEVEGHLLPRASGAALGGVFSAASARASEDEEGRAILLEQRAGLLDAARQAELARRYLAAASVRDGAEFWDTYELVLQTGADVVSSVELCCRVHRGGGLARELIYFAGHRRVAAALAQKPQLERLQRHGRVSLVAAEALLSASLQLDDDRNVI